MIPILYEMNETAFESQGLGRLSDAISCVVIQERNGIYELEMEYPVDGLHWKDVRHSRIIFARPEDGKNPQPFSIYRISKPLNGRCMVYARHISYQLSHIPVMPFTAYSFTSALNGLVTYAAEACPFTVWTDKVATGEFKVPVPTPFRSLLGGTQGSLMDVFGTVEYEFDKYTVYARSRRGVDRGVVLRYGKNITDLKQEENIENTITGICPYWVDRQSDECMLLPEKVLWSDKSSRFPYKRTIPVDFTGKFEEKPSEAELRAAGKDYIRDNDIGIPDVSIDLSFIPLWQTEEYKNLANQERVNLCDTITVVFEKLGVSAQAKVIKTEFDVLKNRYRSIEVGNAKTTLADSIAASNVLVKQEVKNSVSVLQAYINHITEKITGGKGGFIVFNYNADGEPEEMLVMNTNSEATATSIIRINKNGIGFSTDGGATYKTGWTIDGIFCADFIGTGTLDADLIRSGRIQGRTGGNYWDLDSGEFVLQPTVKIGDSDGPTLKEKFDTAIKEVDVEYASGSSDTVAPTSGWQTTAPAWEAGKYIWSRTKSVTESGVSYSDPVCIQGAKGETGAAGKGITAIEEQYYLSTSSSTQTGGSWQVTPPEWQENHYIWTRSKITWDDGTETYTNPVLARAINKALELASTAQIAADNVRRDFDTLNTQTGIFNKLTNNGQVQGIYLQDQKLYINAEFIKTGTMSVDRIRFWGFIPLYTDGDLTGTVVAGYLSWLKIDYGFGDNNGISLMSNNRTHYIFINNSRIHVKTATGEFCFDGKTFYHWGSGAYLGTEDRWWVAAYIGTLHYTNMLQESDRRVKQNIRFDLDRYTALFDCLRPVTFEFLSVPGKKRMGFIAQDVQKAQKETGTEDIELVVGDEETETLALNYVELIPLLVHEVQQLKDEIRRLKEGGWNADEA